MHVRYEISFRNNGIRDFAMDNETTTLITLESSIGNEWIQSKLSV